MPGTGEGYVGKMKSDWIDSLLGLWNCSQIHYGDGCTTLNILNKAKQTTLSVYFKWVNYMVCENSN